MDQIQSHSIKIKPQNSRCRYWAKIVRAGQPLPLPSSVTGANDINAPYCLMGDEELFPGDVLIEGEANHHRRTDRGWSYWVSAVLADGTFINALPPSADIKTRLKAQGLRPELLAGAGDIAACVRIAHAARDGLRIVEPTSTEAA